MGQHPVQRPVEESCQPVIACVAQVQSWAPPEDCTRIYLLVSGLSGLAARGCPERLLHCATDTTCQSVLQHCSVQGGWVLVDLESAARLDRPPGSFTCVDWTADTLTGGLYTAASDVQLVGRLMLPWHEQLSSSGRQLAEAKHHAFASARPMAQAALSHP